MAYEILFAAEDPGFLDRIAKARAGIRAGRGVRIEDLSAVFQKGNQSVTNPSGFSQPEE